MEAEFGQTYGQWVEAKIRHIFNEATLAIVAPDETLVPFPRTAVWGDPRRGKVLDDYTPEMMDDLRERCEAIALEGVLLVLGSLPQSGWAPDDPVFVMVADLAATFYVRGYILGIEQGVNAPIPMEDLNEYIRSVVTYVDQQVAELEGLDDPDREVGEDGE